MTEFEKTRGEKFFSTEKEIDSIWYDNMIYQCRGGSMAYDIHTPTSDVDIFGIYIPTLKQYFNLQNVKECRLAKSYVKLHGYIRECEGTMYPIDKFFHLAAKCNTNVLELLFVPDNEIIYMNEFGHMLIENRKIFLSKRVKYTFTGYSSTQFQKLTTKKKVAHMALNNESPKQPVPLDFLDEVKLLKAQSKLKDKYKNKYPDLDPSDIIEVDNYIDKGAYLSALNEYKDLVKRIKVFKSFSTERRENYKVFGYDLKFAAHSLRVLFQGCDLLISGTFCTRLKEQERQLVKDIRVGKVSYDEFVELYTKESQRLDEVFLKSPLPEKPNWDAINDLLVKIVNKFHKSNLITRKDVVRDFDA